MAIYHLHAQVIGRGKGRSSVAAAAYRAACKLLEQIIDNETGTVFEIVHDYTKKSGVVFSKILAPENAPLWVYDREVLWNKVQNEFEIRKNSQFCRELDIALPCELSEEENIKLLQEFVYESFVKEGMVADVNFHNDNPENPHAHIMLSTREIVKDVAGDYTFGNKVRHWNSNEFLVHTRRMWAGFINKHLELAGIEQEVSHLSHEERGISLVPGIKEGVARFINGAERKEINREIKENNAAQILENPELIIDQHFRDKTVFTKEEVAKVLFDNYTATEVGSRSGGEGNDIEEKIDGRIDNQKALSDYIAALDKVMSSDKVAIIEGRDVYGKQLYTSKDRIELERSFFETASNIKDAVKKERTLSVSHNLNLSDEDLDRKNLIEKTSEFLKEKASQYLGFDYDKIVLTDQQRKVVLDVLNSENGVSVIEGLPGTGKTATMREVVRQYKKCGYRVSGCAVSSSAARELGTSSGIRAVNITKLRYELDSHAGRDFSLNLAMDYYRGDGKDNEGGNKEIATQNQMGSKLTAKDVLIVDESSMVDLAEMHYLLSEVEKSGAKLILVGDSNQLPSVGTGGAAEKMAEIFGVSRLTEVKRQEIRDHRNATELLARYKISEAIGLYRDTGVFRFCQDIGKAKDAAVRDYVQEYLSYSGENEILSSKIALLAYTNRDIAYLNSSIRAKLLDSGVLRGGEKEFRINRAGEAASIALSRGEQIVFTRNSQYLGVSNSDVAEVVGFGRSKDNLRDTIIVKVLNEDGKSTRNIEIDNFHFKGFDYGYAINIYKSEGKTYESVLGLIDEHIGYNGFNVMATRHKRILKLYTGYDVLHNELYKKISLDPDQAGREYALQSSFKDEESSRYAGLVALVQRRVDTSFAMDYERRKDLINGVHKADDKIDLLARYIEVRSEVIKVRQANSSWFELERIKGRVRQYNESPYHDDLKPLLEEREKLAGIITDNYDDYKNLIIQSKINYNTIERHGGRSEYKYYFKRIDYTGSVRDIGGFDKILELQKELNACESGELFKDKILKCMGALHEVTLNIKAELEEHKLEVERARLELDDISEEKYKAECYLEEGTRYIKSRLLGYLDETFKGDAEHEILKKWEELKSEKGRDNALREVSRNPQILGKLRGVGIGNLLALSIDRAKAQENLEVLTQKLEKYEVYKEKIPELHDKMGRGEFDKEILEKEMELKALESKLPSRAVQEYIEKAYLVSKTSNIEIQTNRQTKTNKIDSFESILSWAKDEKVSLESNQYREIFEVSKKVEANGKGRDNLLVLEEKLRCSGKEYIKERNALLAKYEYSRCTSDAAKLYRKIAGSIDPDLAYDILKNIHYIGVASRITKEMGEVEIAEFTILSDNLSEKRLQVIKDNLLTPVHHTINYSVREVEIISKDEMRLNSIKKSIESNLKNIINNNDLKKYTIDEYCKMLGRSEEYAFEYLAVNQKEPNIYLQEEMIERAIYEIDNKPGWILTLERCHEYPDTKNERYSLSAGERILIDKRADRIVAIESRLLAESRVEGKVINNHIIEREARKIEATRADKIKEIYKNNKYVKDLAEIDKQAATYMAEHLVDYGFKYGDEKLSAMPEHYINLLKNISFEQSNATKEVSNEFDRTNSKTHYSKIDTKYKSKVFTSEIIDKDRKGAIELAKYEIHKSITREAVICKLELIDVAKAQSIRNEHTKEVLRQLTIMQKEFKQARELEIRNNRELSQSKSKSLGLESNLLK